MNNIVLFLRRRLMGILLLALVVFSSLAVAQESVPSLNFPQGFDMWYVLFFCIGMVLHFIVKLVDAAGGWTKSPAIFTSNFFGQFASWFFNKFHLTLLAGVPAAIVALASQFNLDNLPLGSVTLLGAFITIGAGYIGDSAFNNIGSNPLAKTADATKP